MRLALLCFLGFTQILSANPALQCPNCQEVIELELELESIRAKIVPGAGWYCDNCGQFQCHGTQCWWCKHPKK